MLFQKGHLSPFEHASFTFFVEGISRACSHQLVRHRIASFSQRSQRFVGHKEYNYVVPKSLKHKGIRVAVEGEIVDAEEFYCNEIQKITQAYNRLCEVLGDNGIPCNEDARYILPNACETKLVVTMNARSLLHFFEERLCIKAQWEIRDVAMQMLQIVKELSPNVFKNAGPKCSRLRYCPEGDKECWLER